MRSGALPPKFDAQKKFVSSRGNKCHSQLNFNIMLFAKDLTAHNRIESKCVIVYFCGSFLMPKVFNTNSVNHCGGFMK